MNCIKLHKTAWNCIKPPKHKSVNELKEYEFMKIDDSSVFKSKKSKISVDDEVMCEITAIRYDKKQYSCIGKLIQ